MTPTLDRLTPLQHEMTRGGSGYAMLAQPRRLRGVLRVIVDL